MSDWQPIETAPKDGSWFLACDKHVPFAYRARWDGNEYVSEDRMVSLGLFHSWSGWPPDMWTYLPDPPHMRSAWLAPPVATAEEGEND